MSFESEKYGDAGSKYGSKREVRAVKKDRCKFQMSMKFENIDVKDARLKSGSAASSEEIIGVRKCFGHSISEPIS